MSHDPDHPAFKHPLTRAVDAVIEAVEHVLHSQRADLLRHALTDLITRLLEQVAATSSRMSVLAHQRIETLAARVAVLEATDRAHADALAALHADLGRLETHLQQQDADRHALRQAVERLGAPPHQREAES